jgi:hypothetical protein
LDKQGRATERHRGKFPAQSQTQRGTRGGVNGGPASQESVYASFP